MRELDDLINEAVDVAELSLGGRAPSASVRAATVRRVRRRHAVRHTAQSAGVLAIGAIVASASWFGLQHDDEPTPAVTPTQSATPAPTPASSPTPTPTLSVAETLKATWLPESVGLPAAHPYDPALLPETGAGWSLLLYAPGRLGGVNDMTPVPSGSQVLFLSSPQGDLYKVAELPTDQQVELTGWEAGLPRVLLDTGRGIHYDFDLVTGALTVNEMSDQPEGAGAMVEGIAADGTILWGVVPVGWGDEEDSPLVDFELWADTPGQAPRLITDEYWNMEGIDAISTDGLQMVKRSRNSDLAPILTIPDGSHSSFTGPRDDCPLIGWVADGVMTRCADDTLYLGTSDGQFAPVQGLAEHGCVPETMGELYAGGYIAGGLYVSLCEDGYNVMVGTALRLIHPIDEEMTNSMLAPWWRSGASGGRYFFVLESRPERGGLLTLHDLQTGSAVVVGPAAPDDGDDEQFDGLQSWTPGIVWTP